MGLDAAVAAFLWLCESPTLTQYKSPLPANEAIIVATMANQSNALGDVGTEQVRVGQYFLIM